MGFLSSQAYSLAANTMTPGEEQWMRSGWKSRTSRQMRGDRANVSGTWRAARGGAGRGGACYVLTGGGLVVRLSRPWPP